MGFNATLTPRQARFITAFQGNATKAAIEAGYSARSARQHATRMLSNAAIQAALAVRQAADSQRLQIGRQDVLKGLLETFEMAKEKGEPAAMVSACRELGRMLGFYEPQRHAVEVGSAGVQVQQGRYQAMSDAELVSLFEHVIPTPP